MEKYMNEFIAKNLQTVKFALLKININCAFRKTPQENFIERLLAKVSFLPEKSYLLLSDGSFMLLVVVRDTIKFDINNKCIFLLYGRKL